MKIVHHINSFFFKIFPELENVEEEQMVSALKKYYSHGPFKPAITVNNDLVTIEIDTDAIIEQEKDYKKTVELCEKGKYDEAKPILEELLKRNPANSEYHRIMGQILSDEGKQDEALNHLIEAIRWDPQNHWALLMLGNIFLKHKNDMVTAMNFYNKALEVHPNDHITINNIGANLMQQGKFKEARKYFLNSVKVNDEYPNSHYALSMIAEKENDIPSAFSSAVKALKSNVPNNILYQNTIQQLLKTAKSIIKTDVGKKIYSHYLVKLEFECKTNIDVVEDSSILTAAKLELAENYKRKNHILKYNPEKVAFEHLVMHELVHLDFIVEARQEDFNQVFLSTDSHRNLFYKQLGPTIKRFKKEGYPEETITKYISGIFDGINLQIFNTPVDLFIESFLYDKFPDLQPYQFLSLYSIVNEGIQAVTEKKIVELSPPDILSKSKILNLVGAIQFKNLFGFDLTSSFKATQQEFKQAEQFYNEFLHYNDDREPGEEYELVQHWAEDLNLDKYFELRDEKTYRESQNPDSFLDTLEEDMFGTTDTDAHKERLMKKFQESQKEMGTNMAVMWFMVDALEYFEGMEKEDIKKIAFEIALQGTQGYRPEKKDYTISSIPGKKFSGYNILAYYFVSWALAVPDMLSQLQLPYEKEYQQALSFHHLNK